MTAAPRPVICMVTDRRRSAPTEISLRAQQRALIALIADAAAAGVDLIYIREHDLTGQDLHGLVAEAVRTVRGSSTRLIVGDRADVALSAGADGVHLPALGPPVARMRAWGPAGWLIGRSAHSPVELDAATEADYVIFGTVFPTASKPGVVAQGAGALAEAVRRVGRPVLAIGGVTAERARECASAGAAGVAAISLFMPHAPGGMNAAAAVRMLRESFSAD